MLKEPIQVTVHTADALQQVWDVDFSAAPYFDVQGFERMRAAAAPGRWCAPKFAIVCSDVCNGGSQVAAI
jgi:hypothetical protein